MRCCLDRILYGFDGSTDHQKSEMKVSSLAFSILEGPRAT